MRAAWRSALRHVLLDVLREDFVDQCLVPNAASTSFLSKLIEDCRIDSDGDQASWFVAHRRTTDSTHDVELFSRRLGEVREINRSRGTPPARDGSPGAR